MQVENISFSELIQMLLEKDGYGAPENIFPKHINLIQLSKL